MDTYVEVSDLEVLRVRADMRAGGPPEAFALLESKLSTLKGRRFYGSFQVSDRGEEYFACVVRTASDDPIALNVETGKIPGGLYARRTLVDWESKISSLPILFDEMGRLHDADPTRPSLEFYRSQSELQLLLPVRTRKDASPVR